MPLPSEKNLNMPTNQMNPSEQLAKTCNDQVSINLQTKAAFFSHAHPVEISEKYDIVT